MSKKNPYWTNITEQKPNRTVPSSTEEKKKKEPCSPKLSFIYK